MNQDFFLDQKRTTMLVAVFLVLLALVFIAGYLSGIIVGLPESGQETVVVVPAVKPQPGPPVVAMQVPPVEEEPEEAVEITEPEPEPEKEVPPEKLYSVQVGAFRTRERAEAHKQQLVAKGYHPYIYHGENSKGVPWYTLRIGDFDQVDEAVTAANDFKALEGSSVVLTHFDSLMMVRDDSGKRIEITPPENTTSAVDDSVKGTAADEGEASGGGESEAVTEEPEAVTEKPETVTGESEAVGKETDGTGGTQITFALPAKTTPVAADGTASDASKAVGGLIVSAETYKYAVQVGAFLNGDNAVKFARKLKGLGYPAYVFHYTDTSGKAWHAVRAGDFKDPDSARSAAEDFEEKEQIAAIVTRIDAIKMVF